VTRKTPRFTDLAFCNRLSTPRSVSGGTPELIEAILDVNLGGCAWVTSQLEVGGSFRDDVFRFNHGLPTIQEVNGKKERNKRSLAESRTVHATAMLEYVSETAPCLGS
jgi:hypothetical protein